MMFAGNSGWVAKRRGIIDHLYDGRLNLTEYVVLDLMLLLASRKTGIWRGSAPALVAFSGGSLKLRTVQEALKGLEANSYILRGREEGKHGNYPILIDKYEVTDGPHEGTRTCVAKSASVQEPFYQLQEEGRNEEKERKAPSEDGSSNTVSPGGTQDIAAVDTRSGTPGSTPAGTLTTPDTRQEKESLKEERGGGGFADAEEKTTKDSSGEINRIITLCYQVADKTVPVEPSSKTLECARTLLQESPIALLESALMFAASDTFWKQLFRESNWPVNRLLKSLASLLGQLAKTTRPVASSKKAHTNTPAKTEVCKRCDGAGFKYSSHLKADLPCSCPLGKTMGVS